MCQDDLVHRIVRLRKINDQLSMLESTLKLLGVPVFTLDGDALRTGLCKDLGFSQDDRVENIRRAGEVAKILNAAGITVLAAFITPAEDLRCTLRGMFQQNAYVEVFVDSPLVVCELRDPKGLYRRARSGEIPNFTGISAPFEPPATPDLVIPTGMLTEEESLELLLSGLEAHFPDLIPASSLAQLRIASTNQKELRP